MAHSALSTQQITELSKRHTFFDWMPQGSMPEPMAIAGGKGAEFWTTDGKKFLDLCSQLWCVNVGHGHPGVIAAISEQLSKLPYASPFFAHEARAKLGQALAEVLPGDINKVFFTLGGAESNEHAVKIARMVTGRHKVLARYRSYHGSTLGAASLTGDPRRWVVEPGLAGVVRAPDFHRWGKPEPETAEHALAELEDVIRYEGGHTLAAFILEPIVGANGLLIPPDGYMQGVRALCDRHGIMLITDEVMSGFGRSGKWFAVEHWGVVPDIITFSKGLTSGYVPLGGVGVREHIAEHFERNAFMTGLTYNSHPLACSAALACIEAYANEGLIDNSEKLGARLSGLLAELAAKHRCVGAVRNKGLFGAIELVRSNEPYTPLTEYNSSSPEMATLKEELLKRSIYTFLRWNYLTISPPLCITEAELVRGVNAVDEALSAVDALLQV